jgi:hypothetical protein
VCVDTNILFFILTFDRHFTALLGSGYKPRPISPEEFIASYL